MCTGLQSTPRPVGEVRGHRAPADIEDCGPRLNFTFRNVRNHHPKCPLYAQN